MRAKLGEAFQVARNGGQVRFGLGYGNASPVLFDLLRATLTKDANAPGLAAAKIAGLPVTNWEDGTAPTLAGRELKLKPNETSRALAITPDGTRFVLGTEWSLRLFDRDAHEVWAARPVSDSAWHVNITADGRLIVAAFGDGTIRWSRVLDGQEVLALFIHPDGQRWITWTPQATTMLRSAPTT
jgi:WD40 repeat protein